MTVQVKLSELKNALADFDTGYLLSVGADARVKVIAVSAQAEGDTLRVPGTSGGTSRNVALNPAVTLLFPPREPKGMSLIVDAEATDTGDGFTLAPSHAVLHRPADHAGPGFAGSSDCGHDCHPVGE